MYDKDDDHLAQMMELLGRMPKNMALSGKNSKQFFNSYGHLKRISGLNFWPLKKVLIEKYKIKREEATALSDFLLPMLEWDTDKRATARDMLNHPWLDMEENYNFKYTEREFTIMQYKEENKKNFDYNMDDDKNEMNELIESDEELNMGDNEFEHNVDEFYDMSSMGNLSDIFEDDDAKSLCANSDEEKERYNERKERDGKINNSFTGPYPLDPTDFNHTDKGANAQF